MTATKKKVKSKKLGTFSMSGALITVSVVSTIDNGDSAGASNSVDKTINLAYDQNEEAMLATFFHECFHMALGLAGQTEMMKEGQEEGVVIALETAFAPLLSTLIQRSTAVNKTSRPARVGSLMANVSMVTNVLSSFNKKV